MKRIILLSGILFFSFQQSLFAGVGGDGKKQVNDACMNFGDIGFGHIGVGLRGSSAFLDPAIGLGYGLEVKFRPYKRINIQLYSDYFNTNILGLGHRYYRTIGGEVLYYWTEAPLLKYKITPFLLSGLAFDYSYIYSHYPRVTPFSGWYPAFHFGYGQHYRFYPNWDITWESFYSVPLGEHGVTSINNNEGRNYLAIADQPGASYKGGVFFIISINYLFNY